MAPQTTLEKRTDSQRYEDRNKEAVKVKRANNGFVVQDRNGEHVYLELGLAVPREGDDPLNVAEHLAAFFDAPDEGG